MNNQVKLELHLLKMWFDNGIKEIYKRKNRIHVYKREGLVRYELFYDLTHRLFDDLGDVADYVDAVPEDFKGLVEIMIKNREYALSPVPTIDPVNNRLDKEVFINFLDVELSHWNSSDPYARGRADGVQWVIDRVKSVPPVPTIKPGDKVIHPSYGEGVVRAVETSIKAEYRNGALAAWSVPEKLEVVE